MGVPRERGFRTDIQALRAVAVMVVVVNHLRPSALTGGYVGVDVFFVISGFLITSHLDREILRTGRVRLGRFYARRVRRLLPAALLVLVVSLIAAYFLLPYLRWKTNAHEALASALYVENWLLAVNSVDYSAFTAVASLAQHYWSLSVEEQFYLCWPLLLLLLFKVRRRRAQVVGITAIGLASLAFCVFFTEVSKSQAYFVTPTRVWEFALGALIALGGTRLVLPRVTAGLAAFAGLAMICGAAALFDHSTPFPGYAALLPTVGTGLVILAGNGGERQWHTALSASAPVQFLGGISYSLYLWHWPLVVLAPFALADTLDKGALRGFHQVGILVVAIVLAWLSKVLVEDRGIALGAKLRTGANFAAMVAGMAAVALVAGLLVWTYDRHVTQASEERRVEPTHCAGAAAMAAGCENPYGPARLPIGVDDAPWRAGLGVCDYKRILPTDGETATTAVCDFSGPTPDPTVVWLVGDSHAEQWLGALLPIARAQKWKLMLGRLGGCPFAKIPYVGFEGGDDRRFAEGCMQWVDDINGLIRADRPERVFVSFYARRQLAHDKRNLSQVDYYREGTAPFWREWTGFGAKVHVLADPPLNGAVRAPDCVALNPRDPLTCAVDRADAQPADPLTEVARTTPDPDVSLIDTTDSFCDPTKCYAVIGGVPVYYDANHISLPFGRSLSPVVAARLGLSTD
ncbi:acyltransferase family protein [Actinokineospora auranticolor]|uniref:acyltransferase family protein n=1 Tax=Actinokineospora auranticolor TaxID=155976 RepID=UPI001FE5EA90|nr:acyltransferase family protein [Actinokineospora auranticolor]